MTGEEILTLAGDIADEEIPQNLGVHLLNVAKNRREDSRPWMFLRKLDSSRTAATGNAWNTPILLPTDFRYERRVLVGPTQEYFPVPIDDRVAYKNAGRRYAVDVANDVYYLLGNVAAADTIYFHYIRTTTDYGAGTLTTSLIVWPERFQPLLAYDIAAVYKGGVDYDEVNARMAPVNRQMAKELEDAMIQWDQDLLERSMNHSLSRPEEVPFDLGQL
jgi:hypothetical protein